MKTNNKFKNSVFTLLFSEPALLRELYCALDGVSLPPDAPVTINTLENVLFMGQYNDISFEIGGKQVVLIEHQSTINPNMALRLLMYIGRVYEKIVEGRSIYSEKLLKIPRPEFFVLYNGVDPFPDEKVYKLSDAFEELKSLGLSEKESPALELTVRVININEGRNKAIVDRCKKLSEYSAFVAKTRAFSIELGDREEAVKKAIIFCKKHGILVEFLKAHAAEVLGMLLTEWNLDDAIAVARKESREKGLEEGIEKGREEGLEEGRTSEKLEIARNLLSKGSSLEFVCEITGLDIDTIEDLQAGL
ncbi:MAG: Rpn family recombination-promoting nuclease/putative transposase [Treponema sp.]|jgi:predicted transposase/invertase (TIGR01784 family)|nr:Rpn family recombination-promoting nuclease/putative transposase [Treponema sp.]